VMLATIGLCFILENVKPRVRVVPESEALTAPPTRAKTTEQQRATASAGDGRSSSA